MLKLFKIKKYMLNMLGIFKRKEESTTFIEERAYFKMNFWRFYMKRRRGGSSLEFWAHLTLSKHSKRIGEHCLYEETDFYIGRVKDGEFHRAKDFYTLPWSVEKGGEKLFQIYLKDRKNLDL